MIQVYNSVPKSLSTIVRKIIYCFLLLLSLCFNQNFWASNPQWSWKRQISGGSLVKNPPAKTGDVGDPPPKTGDMGDPPAKTGDVGDPPAKTGDVGDTGLIPGAGRCPGGGNGNLFQYSCWENPMDRGAWRTIAHGVTKSPT